MTGRRTARTSPSTDAGGVAVVAANLHKRHGQGGATVVAVDDVSFELAAGELAVLVGASGSGKSTLLGILGGWVRPDAGRALLHGRPVQVDDPPAWTTLAVVPQQLGLLPELTLRENVELARRWQPRDPAPDLDALFASLGLDGLADRRPHEVSLGEQQRGAIARALANQPSILLADEPTSHQDERSAALVTARFAEAAAAGTTCLLATHDPRQLDLADRILRMRDGVLTEG